MFISFEELDKEIYVRYDNEMPLAHVFVIGKQWKSKLGENLICLANNVDLFNSEVIKHFFNHSGNNIDTLHDKLYVDLLTLCGKSTIFLFEDGKKEKSKDLYLPYVHENSDFFLSKSKPMSFKSLYLQNTSSNVFSHREVFEIDNLHQALAIEIIKYTEALEKNRVRPINRCSECENFFIMRERTDQIYCSEKCRLSAFNKKVKEDAYYRKFRNLCSNISRLLNDDEQIIYGYWQKFAKSELVNLAEVNMYSSADEYGNAMRQKWRDMKRGD